MLTDRDLRRQHRLAILVFFVALGAEELTLGHGNSFVHDDRHVSRLVFGGRYVKEIGASDLVDFDYYLKHIIFSLSLKKPCEIDDLAGIFGAHSHTFGSRVTHSRWTASRTFRFHVKLSFSIWYGTHCLS